MKNLAGGTTESRQGDANPAGALRGGTVPGGAGSDKTRTNVERTPRRVAVLGCTGSVGTQTLSVIRRNPGRLAVCALVCHSDTESLMAQIAEFRPAYVGVSGISENDPRAHALKRDFPEVSFCFGERALEEGVREDADVVAVAATGLCALGATLKAIALGKAIAFASKEILVSAGHIVMPRAREKGVPFLPVDSEHSAIFQCLQGRAGNEVSRVILTASGGAFRDLSAKELKKVRARDALRHPTWKMGKKITVDCATLVNKGLEVIEATWLFDLPPERVDAVIHPQSVIHSMVEFGDGAVLAQLSEASMELPISYALLYPERRPCGLKPLDFGRLGELTFQDIDEERFPSFSLAKQALIAGGFAPLVFNAANEVGVEFFLEDRILYPEIYEIQRDALEHFDFPIQNDPDCVYYIDGEVKAWCRQNVGKGAYH